MGEDLRVIEGLVRKWGLVEDTEDPSLIALGGGVSNRVVKVQGHRGTWVIKQALGQLRVRDEWHADRSRIFREVACLKALREFVGPQFAPEVFIEDREAFACAMECAPEGSRTWKQDLLKGIIDPTVTERVAVILADLHRRTCGHPQIRHLFGDITNFIELRVDPYFTAIARRHPDLQSLIEETVHPLMAHRFCLVHGDYSPKNILLLPDGRLWVLDCEVAHYGNPAFDIAFCTNHLFLKAIHLRSPDHLAEAKRLWRCYWRHVSFPGQTEREAVRALAILLLARVDGKSPVEYLTDEGKRKVRSLSRGLIANRVDEFERAWCALALQVGGDGGGKP